MVIRMNVPFPSAVAGGDAASSSASSSSLLPSQAALARWRPGVPGNGHEEVFASVQEGGGSALALGLAMDALRAQGFGPQDQRPFLWVQDRMALRLSGRPCRSGLPPGLRHRLIHVLAANAQDALFALEEGLRCRELAFVIGEMTGNPGALDFTASRRLSLAAQRHGVPLWLVRLDAQRDLSSARMRWAVRSAPSASDRWNAQAPGAPHWRATLFRARNHPPGEWTLGDDGQGLVFAGEGASTDMPREQNRSCA